MSVYMIIGGVLVYLVLCLFVARILIRDVDNKIDKAVPDENIELH